MDVSKNTGTPKMDGENNGKPPIKMDELGVPLFLETPIYTSNIHTEGIWLSILLTLLEMYLLILQLFEFVSLELVFPGPVRVGKKSIEQ